MANGKITRLCHNCEADKRLAIDSDVEDGSMGVDAAVDDGVNDGTRARSKSPLVNSAERTTKCQRTDIHTPLAPTPFFPAIISGDKGKGIKGKGGRWVKGKRKGGKKGTAHGVRRMEAGTHGVEVVGGMAVEVAAKEGENHL